MAIFISMANILQIRQYLSFSAQMISFEWYFGELMHPFFAILMHIFSQSVQLNQNQLFSDFPKNTRQNEAILATVPWSTWDF